MPVDHARLTELFTQAIDLPEAAREALIAAARAEDPALGAELAALLVHDDSIITALRTAGLKPDAASTTLLRKPTLPVDAIAIPNFRLRGPIGKGGMGVVYDADQVDPPRRVAIKVLHVASAEALARFHAEAAIMLALDHPCIARVLASGEANGHPYIVMERVDGTTLDVHVRREAPPLAAKLALFAMVCDAVQFAHERGVIHRDLKPTNIMVRASGGIAILDFGVARIRHSTRTQQGDFLGTLMYMSPEQATGQIADLDVRADVYSLGVILFELVRGTLPYDLADLHTAQAVRRIVTEPPRPLDSGIPALDAIAARALAKRIADRQASAAELALAIRAVA
jgi:serine/threonine protein kinase